VYLLCCADGWIIFHSPDRRCAQPRNASHRPIGQLSADVASGALPPAQPVPPAQPHDDSAYPRAVETFLALEGASEASKRKILWDNRTRLYGI
jgi:hypothetical protein